MQICKYKLFAISWDTVWTVITNSVQFNWQHLCSCKTLLAQLFKSEASRKCMTVAMVRDKESQSRSSTSDTMLFFQIRSGKSTYMQVAISVCKQNYKSTTYTRDVLEETA